MKKFSLVLLMFTSMYASELIFVSNDTSKERLESLYQTYGQELLINDKHVYLISSECTIERYFGGASQGDLKQVNAPAHTTAIPLTQEVFEAKDAQVITQKIELDKSIALIEGKSSKEFLADKEGRAFGGVSELPLNMSVQKREAQRSYMIEEKQPQMNVETEKSYRHPSCTLLENGSGYELQDITNASFYSNKGLIPVVNTTILFK